MVVEDEQNTYFMVFHWLNAIYEKYHPIQKIMIILSLEIGAKVLRIRRQLVCKFRHYLLPWKNNFW